MAKVITMINGVPKLSDEASAQPPYSETLYYSSGLAANTAITLPNSGSFTDASAKDIFVILNDLMMEVIVDFEVVGAGPTYTQIKFVYDIPSNSRLRFIQGSLPSQSSNPVEDYTLMSKIRSGVDTEGLYTTITYKREDNTTAMTSILSGGTTPEYTTRTVRYYQLDGSTEIVSKRKVYTLSYEAGKLVSEILT